jgi:hypothetical protein
MWITAQNLWITRAVCGKVAQVFEKRPPIYGGSFPRYPNCGFYLIYIIFCLEPVENNSCPYPQPAYRYATSAPQSWQVGKTLLHIWQISYFIHISTGSTTNTIKLNYIKLSLKKDDLA